MLFSPEIHGQLAEERIEREIAAAELLRQARLASQPAPSIRQWIGHRIIAIGARLAAEPPLESARSR
jgi:hypothetical protein